MQQVAK